ncbi:hypothetical protein [Cohnella herbarum]|uniref:Uncharacterized protein n=1 Tax=Cohnella herbarum TaxID=2728023 RepID=A0A7Z2VHE1_9BACL|nr:hypothetical protein [Cohnella herbarum]QJD83223.1 hypothetical protein HH215_08585 [Cohnella herbarum]
MDNKYNPYDDKTIHTTQPDSNFDLSERQGFNDVIKHYDAVNGFQNPKQLNHFPRSLRQIIRWAIIINISIFLGFEIYQFLKSTL